MDFESSIDRFFSDYPPEAVVGLEDDSGATIILSGALDMKFSKDLQDFLSCLIDCQERRTKITVDLTHISYISSTGVGALANAMIVARKRDLAFVLKNMQPKVRSVFELLGLMKFFDETSVDD